MIPPPTAVRNLGKGQTRGILCAVLLLPCGCLGTSVPDRRLGDLAEAGATENVETLAVRLNEYAIRFSGVVEAAADRIVAASADPVTRKRALVWKIEAIPACHLACFRTNPLGGLVDAWTLAAQLRDYFVDGDGKDDFGEHQPIAVSASETLLDAADAVGRAVFEDDGGLSPKGLLPEQGGFETMAAEVRAMARELPVRHPISSRLSPIERFARYARSERGALAVLATIEQQLRWMERRVHVYAEHLPKQARWQAELLAEGVLGDPDVSAASRSLVAIGENAAQLSRDIERLDGLIDEKVASLIEAFSAERRLILENITTQRVEALKVVREERAVLLEAIRAERATALSDLETALGRVVGEAFSKLDERSSRAVLWAAPAAAAALALLAVLVWAVARRRGVRVELTRNITCASE